MKFLIDTNVWLEMLLKQERASESVSFLQQVDPQEVALTDFSLYSVALAMTQLKKDNELVDFVSDALEDSGFVSIGLELADLKTVIAARQRFKLDFDDAYQYAAAEKHNLTLVSFDADFDRTECGRKTPAQIIKEL